MSIYIFMYVCVCVRVHIKVDRNTDRQVGGII